MEVLRVRTGVRDQLVDITDRVQQVVSQRGVKSGLCVVFVPHTTAGVTINENADPDVVTDMLTVLDKLVPWRANYRHGEGNSAAHIKASLLGSSVTVIIEEGRLQLGTWQGIYLAEFDGPRERKVYVKVQG
ncbi:secondary thiamine-phosphate synthase enzyme [Carboxydocella sporoproducens DSM 16521]|uniref:Secondary thiamine-phosphate synthase enzyme n=2 Tax=Carboxydocella TaxID=178898 RepID=A0A1T4RWE3_9FIRM|nr:MULTISPECIES: secondary thiamine-phosphate synthase enzyme YjbQ [Carboxydocella]AVX20261.1 secondary thiamine-phosphate synthase enzyme [Carboxydocella thermautotrophica]SKA20300.1 secondary thiamine-phosphate synthase enzyme [Carboxydocella sporoproducens DSM 16521]